MTSHFGPISLPVLLDLAADWAVLAPLAAGWIVYRRMANRIRRLESAHEDDLRRIGAVQALRERLLAGIEAAGDGVALIDAEGRLTYLNAALIALHALSAAEVPDYIGRDWRRLYSPAGQRNIESVVMPRLVADRAWRDELEIMRADGTFVWAELSLKLLPDGSLVGTARDITDRRQAQAEREALQRQYEQAQKMEAIGRMTGGIAHDFNNLLTVVSGHIDILRDDAPETMGRSMVAIQRAIERGSELTQRLLAFARRQVLRPERADLNQLVPEAMTLAHSALGAGIEVTTRLAPEPAFTTIDSGQFENALLNLCINAGDALQEAKKKSICVAIEHVSSDEDEFLRVAQGSPGRYVRVTVADTGSGIPPELLERVIDPFFTTKEVGKGSGLGLSMVYGFATQSGGRVKIDSTVGEGTAIKLYFPAAD